MTPFEVVRELSQPRPAMSRFVDSLLVLWTNCPKHIDISIKY